MLRARYFAEEGSAFSLAIFRIVLFGTIAWFSATVFDFPWFLSLPEPLRSPPPLAGWYARISMTPTTVAVGWVALIISAIAAAVGWNTRVAATVTTVVGVLILGIPQLYGKVDHYHHLVWFAAILAASPCGDSLSVDAWRRRVHSTASSRAYALPLRFIWLLMGCIYFFPGLAKASALPGWVAPDNLRYHLYRKWSEFDVFTPFVPIDQWPVILSLSAAFTIAFELSFIWLVLHRSTRWIAACSGILFHQMTGAVMGIPFLELQVCYVSFVPWERLAEWLKDHGYSIRLVARSERAAVGDVAGGAAIQRSSRLVGLAGLFLVVTAVLAGFARLNSWPFAHYPLFGDIGGPFVVRAELVPRADDGTPISISPEGVAKLKRRFREARWHAILTRLAVSRDPAARDALAQSVVELLTMEDPKLRAAVTVDVYRTVVNVVPSTRDPRQGSRVLLGRVPLRQQIISAHGEDAKHD